MENGKQEKKLSLLEKLNKIQVELKAPKDLFNKFGNYSYRSAESILKALKPHLQKHGLILTMNDTLEVVGERIYLKAVVSLQDVESNKSIEASAYAREPENKKGMDSSQLTGSTSSYARKYALNGLFALNDVKDSDGLKKDDDDKYKKERNYQHMKILEIINGTPIKYEDTKEYIKKMFNKEIKANDLSPEQFKAFTDALYRKIDKLIGGDE